MILKKSLIFKLRLVLLFIFLMIISLFGVTFVQSKQIKHSNNNLDKQSSYSKKTPTRPVSVTPTLKITPTRIFRQTSSPVNTIRSSTTPTHSKTAKPSGTPTRIQTPTRTATSFPTPTAYLDNASATCSLNAKGGVSCTTRSNFRSVLPDKFYATLNGKGIHWSSEDKHDLIDCYTTSDRRILRCSGIDGTDFMAELLLH